MSPFFYILFPFISDSFWKANVCMCCLFIYHLKFQHARKDRNKGACVDGDATQRNRKVNTDMSFIIQKIKDASRKGFLADKYKFYIYFSSESETVKR